MEKETAGASSHCPHIERIIQTQVETRVSQLRSEMRTEMEEQLTARMTQFEEEMRGRYAGSKDKGKSIAVSEDSEDDE